MQAQPGAVLRLRHLLSNRSKYDLKNVQNAGLGRTGLLAPMFVLRPDGDTKNM